MRCSCNSFQAVCDIKIAKINDFPPSHRLNLSLSFSHTHSWKQNWKEGASLQEKRQNYSNLSFHFITIVFDDILNMFRDEINT